MALADLTARFPEVLPGTDSKDHPTFLVPAGDLVAVCRYLRDEFGFSLLLDVTAIDFGDTVEPRFSGRYHFTSPSSL